MNELLRAESLSFLYPQNGRGLGPLSLAVGQGDCLMLAGSSGSGKSTLARCLTGLIPHLYRGEFSGFVWLAGMRTDSAQLWELTGLAGFLFQNPALQMLAPTVEEEILFGLENLGLPRAEIRDRLEAALCDFGLEGLRERSPQTLSGGEQQKLALAAVMARHPRLLVLDEPLSMLDTTAAAGLVERLGQAVTGGQSVVICEHRHEYLRAIPGLRVQALAGTAAEPDEVNPLPEPDLPPLPACEAQTLLIEDLRVQRGGKQILNGLNLRLQSGQVTALVGPNGVGKTTLFRALAGFQPYEGVLRLVGAEEKPRFGMVFQNPDVQLFNGSVREEILYRVAQPDMAWYAWLLQMLDLERYENTPPLLLSEGEKRRAALATVLMRRPGSGILLDEPALGQDAAHKAILQRLLRALAGMGLFVLFSTHDIELAAQAGRLILLGADGIAAEGCADGVMRNAAAWRRIGLARPAWLEAA